jgi:hypothetical protein
MISPYIKKLERETGRSEQEIQRAWNEAKKITIETFGKDEVNFGKVEYRYTQDIVKDLLGINEQKMATIDFLSFEGSSEEFIEEVVSGDFPSLLKRDIRKKKKKKKVVEPQRKERHLRENIKISVKDLMDVLNLEHRFGSDGVKIAQRISDLTNQVLTHGKEDAVLNEINNLIDGFGVEAVTHQLAYVDSYYHDIIATYINLGDTYEPTIVHSSETGEFYLTSWGDFYEEWEFDQGIGFSEEKAVQKEDEETDREKDREEREKEKERQDREREREQQAAEKEKEKERRDQEKEKERQDRAREKEREMQRQKAISKTKSATAVNESQIEYSLIKTEIQETSEGPRIANVTKVILPKTVDTDAVDNFMKRFK